MNDINKIELNKSRSYAACISESFHTFTHNIKTIFTYTWAFALVMSLLLAFYGSMIISCATTASPSAFQLISLFLSLLLCLCASVALFGRASSLVNGQKTRWNIRRAARLMLVTVLFSIVLAVIFSVVAILINNVGIHDAKVQQTSLVGEIVIDILAIVISLVLLPYVYVFIKYMAEPQTRLTRLLLRSYMTGLRHWGFIFVTTFLAYLCMAVGLLILGLPTVIILSARFVSINGVETLGDPAGLPSYFNIMQFALFALASFIWSYISIFCVFVYYFIYGSIEMREKEKKARTLS